MAAEQRAEIKEEVRAEIKEEVEAENNCSICLERRKDCSLNCGHTFCMECARKVKTCQTCRKKITKRARIF